MRTPAMSVTSPTKLYMQDRSIRMCQHFLFLIFSKQTFDYKFHSISRKIGNKNICLTYKLDIVCSYNNYTMLIEKQKNIIPYELYASKKSKEPDYLCNVIRKYKHIERIQAVNTELQYEQAVKRKMNQKRIEEIKKLRKNNKISQPEPYIKRTWISPMEACHKKADALYYHSRRKNESYMRNQQQIQKTKQVCNILNLHKKMHLFGDLMYCQFQGEKQNSKQPLTRVRQKKMDAMHKQYSRLMGSLKKKMVICNKDSDLNKRIFVNPLQQDKYFQKIIRLKDTELVRLLIQTLSVSSNFTFSSFILFYEIFVWQQATKQTQIQFVMKLLIGINNEISYKNLSDSIDMLCSKINLIEHKESLTGFNQVMKKLIFGAEYSNSQSSQAIMSKETLSYSLDINEECISIFINIFYAQ